jgi:DNA-binding CsgD family transcriptional regulator/tetratricopeptide (TPR) repeat protein
VLSPFVGRKEELAAAKSLLEVAKTGSESVYCLEAGPGMGKSALAQKIVEMAREDGFLVLNGSLLEGQELPGLWPWKRILDKCATVIAARGGADYGKLGDEYSSLLENIDTAWGDIPELAAVPATQKKYRYYQWVGRFLNRFCRLTPLFLLLEDIHLADDGSLHLLEYLVDELEYSPVYLLLTWRQGEGRGAARLEKLKDRISFLEHGCLLHPANLVPEEIREYLSQTNRASGPGEVDQVLAWTQGIPLRVALCLQYLRGTPDSNSGSTAHFTGLFWRQVQPALSTSARTTLFRMAMLGNGLEQAEIRALVPDPSTGEEVLQDLCGSGLIQADTGASFHQFFHEEFRRTLLSSISDGEKQNILVDLTSILEQMVEDNPERLSRLLKEMYFSVGDREAIRKGIDHTLKAAGYAIQQNAWAEVISDLEPLIERFGAALSEEEYRRVQMDLCRAYLYSYKFIAKPLMTELMHYYRRIDDLERQIELLCMPVFSMVQAIEQEWDDIYPDVLSRIPENHPRRAELLCAHGRFLRSARNDLKRSRLTQEQALQTATRLGSPYCGTLALISLAIIDIVERKFEKALDILNQVSEAGGQDRDVHQYVYALVYKVWVFLGLGRLRECRECIEQAMQMMPLYQDPFLRHAVHWFRQRFHLYAGNWSAVYAMSPDEATVHTPNVPKAVARYLTGNNREADRSIEQLLEHESSDSSSQVRDVMLCWLIAIRVYITGEEAWLEEGRTRLKRQLKKKTFSPEFGVQFLISTGRLARYTFTAEESKPLYNSLCGYDRYYFEEEEYSIEAAKALFARNWGDEELALQHFQKAVAFCDKYEEKPWRAWYLYEQARLLEDRDRERAGLLLEEATAEAKRLGLQPLTEHIKAYLNRQDRGKVIGRMPAGITRREKEVLCLLARGLTDKEIASELNLSPYTVGNHLRNIYGKIGKNTRGEAVHWAVSTGLITLE